MKFYWHVRHSILVEPADEEKPGFSQVVGELPSDLVAAARKYLEAARAYREVKHLDHDACCPDCDGTHHTDQRVIEIKDQCEDAWYAYCDVLNSHRSEIELLHLQECPNCKFRVQD